MAMLGVDTDIAAAFDPGELLNPPAPVQVQMSNQTVLWVPVATNTAGVTQLPANSPAVGTTDGTANERAYAIDNLFWEFTESLR